MQADFGRQMRAARRALGGRKLGAVWPAWLGAALAVALFAVTVGPVIITGAALPTAVALVPMLAGGFGVAMGLFAACLAVVLLLIYVLAVLGYAWRWRRV
jgi:hypothetical protein